MSILKLQLSSLWSVDPSSPHYYDTCSHAMLRLLCRWKDTDTIEWQYICDILVNVCSKMSEQLLVLQQGTTETHFDNYDQIDAEYEGKVLALEEKLSSCEAIKNHEIEKLQAENTWLQSRLVQKLHQFRYQNDIIDQLKKDLINNVQKTQLSEGRRLCYEHRIRQLEEQLEHNFPQEHKSEPSARDIEVNQLKKTLACLKSEKEEETKTYQTEITKLQTKLQQCQKKGKKKEVSPKESYAWKLTEVQTDLAQKKKEIALLHDLVEEQYCQLRDLHKQLGTEISLDTKLVHLKKLIGKEVACDSDSCLTGQEQVLPECP
ncbi:hypothetical protein Cs308_0251 [Candidatus Chlamydia sanziniae]|uniref:Uncharacterized protein n=1 Tax=Candidatus Chlamydia sanziniae TaxID=1806891 RepID=A0A1A9HWF3_9CHLA|nr:hypothetical protein Cs308_0251 [Candidatus Chlamydia sanziniae]